MSEYKILPEPHRIYRHYKGGLYEFITIAKHSESGEELVIYKSVHYGTVYARPLSMWYDKIEQKEGVYQEYRFEII